jgi:hypothetical protein
MGNGRTFRCVKFLFTQPEQAREMSSDVGIAEPLSGLCKAGIKGHILDCELARCVSVQKSTGIGSLSEQRAGTTLC